MRWRVAVVAVMAATIGACAGVSAPTQFYSLAPTLEASPVAERPQGIAVGPVLVAEYLRRPQIVTRLDDTRLMLADFDQWVEPFDIMFPRILAEDLAAALGTDRISLTPVPRDMRIDHQVEVDVVRFDAMIGQGVVLDALWRVYGRDGSRLLAQSRTTLTRELPAATDGRPAYPDIVLAMSAATGDLAMTIAEAVRSGARR
jgi:uncharacterized lipoprotein YmbA